MANYFEDSNYIRLNDTDWQVLDAYDYWKGPREAPLLSERCIEIALAFRWIDLMNNDIVEVGAVTPYHTISKTLSHPIIDPYDKKATIQDFVENQDLTMDNVLSISTIEHIGMAGGDYDGSGLRQEVADPNASPAALQKILDESENCLVTFPIGYNKRPLMIGWKTILTDSNVLAITRFSASMCMKKMKLIGKPFGIIILKWSPLHLTSIENPSH